MPATCCCFPCLCDKSQLLPLPDVPGAYLVSRPRCIQRSSKELHLGRSQPLTAAKRAWKGKTPAHMCVTGEVLTANSTNRAKTMVAHTEVES
eukprot:1147048-Pelagomonas_calceolata.AAC.4